MTRTTTPRGPKHARCLHHEPHLGAPSGHLCFADDVPSEDAVLDRMVWADGIAATRYAYHDAWMARPTGTGLCVDQLPVPSYFTARPVIVAGATYRKAER